MSKARLIYTTTLGAILMPGGIGLTILGSMTDRLHTAIGGVVMMIIAMSCFSEVRFLKLERRIRDIEETGPATEG